MSDPIDIDGQAAVEPDLAPGHEASGDLNNPTKSEGGREANDQSPTGPEMAPYLSRSSGWGVANFVEEYLEAQSIEVRFDGGIWIKGALNRAESPERVDEFLATDRPTARDILDRLVLLSEAYELGFRKGVLATSLRQTLRQMRDKRYIEVIRPHLTHPRMPETISKPQWELLGSLFDMPHRLAAAVIGHMIWQVKQKARGEPVTNHLMPIIFSAEQGTGKTTFVRKLVAPLQELASANALLSDFADKRSGEIYRFLLVILDDMEKISAAAVPVLKSVLTAESLSRRILQTSATATTQQRATLLGTANRPVHELVEDETGHRRFVMMPFKNGNPSKGGNGALWDVARNLNYEMLWDSVYAYDGSPIEDYLTALYQYQDQGRPVPRLLEWLWSLDLASEKIKPITVRGGVRADALRTLYCADTGADLSQYAFAAEMQKFVADENVPFGGKALRNGVKVYVPKHRLVAPKS